MMKMTDVRTTMTKTVFNHADNEALELIIEHTFSTGEWFTCIAVYEDDNHTEEPDWAFCGYGQTLTEAISNLKTNQKVYREDGTAVPAYSVYPWFDFKDTERR